ncbi:LysR family transcriptional regulator, partial [Ideonella sp. B508-1]|uniref:LysR family transcriptional regulator n=1 Tax=Ideonella sp. B508-1 TaxID=137716 RepID=UPI0003B44E13
MNLQQLETFLHVAEHGSFSKAALVLDVAQPALSRQVRALETELRETLLVRTGRGVTLTPAGSRLLEYCQDILHLVSLAKEDLSAHRHEPVGQITVALPPTLARLYTLPLIQAFPRGAAAGPAGHHPRGFPCTWGEWLQSGRA